MSFADQISTPTSGFKRQNGHIDNAKSLANDLSELVRKILNATSTIERSTKQLGTKKDTHDFRNKLNQTIDEARKYARQTGKALKQLGQEAKRNPEHKPVYDKLRRQVSDALSKFKEVTTLSATKQRETISQAKKEVNKLRDTMKKQSLKVEATEPTETESLIASMQRQEQLHLQNEIQHNETLIAEREEDIREIESSVIEVNQIFKELNYLINEQGENLDLISDHIEKTHYDVQKATAELGQANKYDKRGRTTMCLILLVVIGVAVTIAVVITIIAALKII